MSPIIFPPWRVPALASDDTEDFAVRVCEPRDLANVPHLRRGVARSREFGMVGGGIADSSLKAARSVNRN
jgi:hypothetical protein